MRDVERQKQMMVNAEEMWGDGVEGALSVDGEGEDAERLVCQGPDELGCNEMLVLVDAPPRKSVSGVLCDFDSS